MTSVVVTHQIRDAFDIATHRAARLAGQVRIARGDAETAAHAEFMVLREGRIQFRGTAEELRSCQDSYLKEFLFRTLPPW